MLSIVLFLNWVYSKCNAPTVECCTDICPVWYIVSLYTYSTSLENKDNLVNIQDIIKQVIKVAFLILYEKYPHRNINTQAGYLFL